MRNPKAKLLFTFLFIANLCFSQMDFNSDGSSEKSTYKKEQIGNIDNKIISGNYIDSIPGPTDWIGDITFDGEYIWTGSNDERLYKIVPETGEVIEDIGISINVVDGLTYDGNSLWAAESTISKVIQKINPANGEVEFSFYHNLGNYATHGMAFIDNQIWVNMFYLGATDTTVVFDTNGNVLAKYPNECLYSHGIAFDGCYIWITGTSDIEVHKDYYVYKYTKENFERVDSIEVPGGNGLTFFNDHLWLTNGSSSIYKIDIKPEARFNYEINGLEVTFTNLSKNTNTYLWDFGDSNTETTENPIHTYATTDDYTVILNAFDNYCYEVADTQIISITTTEANNIEFRSLPRIYPNPANDLLYFDVNNLSKNNLAIQIIDVNGTVIYTNNKITKSIEEIDLSNYSSGIYFVKVSNNEYSKTEKIIIK